MESIVGLRRKFLGDTMPGPKGAWLAAGGRGERFPITPAH